MDNVKKNETDLRYTVRNPTPLRNVAFHWLTSGFTLLVSLAFVAKLKSFKEKMRTKMILNGGSCTENYHFERKIVGFLVADCVFASTLNEIYVHQIDDLPSQMTILKTMIP